MNEHVKQKVVEDPRAFWEQRYAGAAPIWSGRVNRTLAEAVADLPPSRALDLGCGEGADVLWLAERGWHATGIDLSETAVQRARQAARARSGGADGAAGSSVEGSADGSADGFGAAVFIAADLADWVNTGAKVDGNPDAFDLITASFLQSPVELPRERILQAALARLAPGGSLVLISHAASPPWVNDDDSGHGHGHGSGGPKFFSPDEELEMLGLTRCDTPAGESEGTPGDLGALYSSSGAEYLVSVAEIRKREVNDPEGNSATIDDSLVVVRRLDGTR